MNAETYSIPQLVADLREIRSRLRDEREILHAVRPLARRAALAKSAWLEPRMYEADEQQGFGVYLLHEEPDHSLAVLALSWLPDRGTAPHDHGTWAVVAGVDGPEKNRFFERTDDRTRAGYAELRQVGEKVCAVGDVLAMPSSVIHSVWNESQSVSVSLHIYGVHINHTGRSQFDPEKKTQTPFLVSIRQ